MAKIDFKKIDTYRKTFDGILQVTKHVGSEESLPTSGAQNGDIYSVGDSNTLYIFNDLEWRTLGSAGVTSATVAVDASTGTPSASASVENGVLSLSFSGLKGEQGIQGIQGSQGEQGPQGNTGSSVDYPYELVNNLTTDDATKGLSAAQGVVLDGKVSQLAQDVTDLNQEVNGGSVQFIPQWQRVGYYLTVNGQVNSSSTWSISSPFILHKGETIEVKTQGSGACIIAKTTDGATYTPIVVAPSGISGLNTYSFSAKGDVSIAISAKVGLNDVVISKIMDSLMSSAQIGINGLTFAKTKNLIDKDAIDFAAGKILSDNKGNLDTNALYNTTGLCEVEGGEKYSFSDGDTMSASSIRFVLFYDETGLSIQDSYASNQASPITAPASARFVKLTYLSSISKPQLEHGERVSVYEPYEILIPRSIIEKEPETHDKLLPMSGVDELATDDVLALPMVHIQKNILLSAKIIGSITMVNVGVGYKSSTPQRDYNSRWLEITATEIKVYGRFNSDAILYHTFTHGVTLDSTTFISVESTLTVSGMNTLITLMNGKGDKFVTTSTKEWGCGAPFIENKGAGNINAKLSFFPRDITKKVWVFGDSYLSFTNDARWAYYAVYDNNLSYLANSKGGQTPEEAFNELQTLLSYGCPSVLIWMLGMNGPGVENQSGGVYVINDYQKTYIDAVLSVCEYRGIIPILYCVPTVPSYQKTGLCNYIRSLGYRYIDVAEAVGTNENGEWTEGLLSNDNVHPSIAGAKVIYGQILTDAPEIGIQE